MDQKTKEDVIEVIRNSDGTYIAFLNGELGITVHKNEGVVGIHVSFKMRSMGEWSPWFKSGRSLSIDDAIICTKSPRKRKLIESARSTIEPEDKSVSSQVADTLASLKPDLLSPVESFKKLDSPRVTEINTFELDNLCFGLKLVYAAELVEDEGWFAKKLYISGSLHDLKPELEANCPKALKKINEAIAEDMEERKNG